MERHVNFPVTASDKVCLSAVSVDVNAKDGAGRTKVSRGHVNTRGQASVSEVGEPSHSTHRR